MVRVCLTACLQFLLVACVVASDLHLSGDGSQIKLGKRAIISADRLCGAPAAPTIQAIQITGIPPLGLSLRDFVLDGPAMTVLHSLHKVKETCTHATVTEPCAVGEVVAAYGWPAGFFCTFAGAGGGVKLGPIHARRVEEDGGYGTLVAVNCSMPSFSQLSSILSGKPGPTTEKVTVGISHFVPAAQGDSFDTNATVLVYAGAWEGDQFEVFVDSPPSPPPKSPPPSPPLPPPSPLVPPPPPPPLKYSCSAIHAADPSSSSGVHMIADADGGTQPMPVHCDMVTSGGGWTLIMVRTNTGGTTTSKELITPSSHGQAMTEERLQALRSGATEVMVQQSGGAVYCGSCSTCVIGDIGRMNQANCKKFSDVSSLTEIMWAHNENSGCIGKGMDYSLFFGSALGSSTTQKTYFSSFSALKFHRPCTAGNPGVTSSFASGSYGMYEIAAVYLRHG